MAGEDLVDISIAQALSGRGLFLTGEDHLRLRSLNSAAGVTLAIEGRILRSDGVLSMLRDSHVPATDRSATTKLFRLTEGWLVDLQVRAVAGTPRRGQCFVVVELVRGFTGDVQPITTLIQGYICDTSNRAWPGSPLELSTEGPGNLRSIAGTDQAANVDISETVPTNARWRIVSIDATLVADATVANRQVAMIIDDGTTQLMRTLASVAQTASQTVVYCFAEFGVFTAVAGLIIPVPLPTGLILLQGWRITTFTVLRQAGDNWGAPRLAVEEWIED